jgi:RimJ/RimL family protein N-acetyltransferase
MAQEFAKAFAVDGVEYINREEDCGDEGLRRSKTQYHPIEIKKKNYVIVNTLFERLNDSVCLESERLTVTPIEEKDKQKYYELYTDDQLNKWWGYDYREDLDGQTPSPEYFYGFQKKMKDRKEEFSFAVREKESGQMVGELVLHNFDYHGGVEIGFRFFKDCQGKGYATESAGLLKNYAFEVLGADKLKSRCFKQNDPSHRLIERLGLKQTYEDNTHYYFAIEKTAIAR